MPPQETTVPRRNSGWLTQRRQDLGYILELSAITISVKEGLYFLHVTSQVRNIDSENFIII